MGVIIEEGLAICSANRLLRPTIFTQNAVSSWAKRRISPRLYRTPLCNYYSSVNE